jgi:predicted aminopeptidase
MGCAGYQGWFDPPCPHQAEVLTAAGLEVQVSPCRPSDAGLERWLGGDPLLNTFIRYPEGELAG